MEITQDAMKIQIKVLLRKIIFFIKTILFVTETLKH